MTATTPDPAPRGRIITVDVLRGFALFGIFYAHMIFWFAGGPLPAELYQPDDPVSGIAVGLYMLLVIGKFFALFSFLFGLSFYLQMRSLSQRYGNFALRFAWRLAILGIIGILHHAIWRADILTIYVPLGFLLIFARHLSNKSLLIIGVVLVLNIPTKMAELGSILWRGELALIKVDNIADGAEYYAVMKDGSFADMVAHNLHAASDKLIYQINSGRLLITFGFFLLGMLAGRLQWFENMDTKAEALKRWWKKAGYIALGCVALGISVAVSLHVGGVNVENAPLIMWAGGFILEVFNVSLTLFYITGISLLMLEPKWQNRLAPLAGVGKMALTVYLLQTVLGLWLFCSFGLGLFAETSPAFNALMCIGLFIALMLFCNRWLRYFTYGPVEWFWRSATDRQWHTLRKRSLPPMGAV